MPNIIKVPNPAGGFSYTAIGAGDEDYNATYSLNGTEGGQRKFQSAFGAFLYFVADSGGQWVMDATIHGDDPWLYKKTSTSPGSEVDIIGEWSVDDGVPGAPTVTSP